MDFSEHARSVLQLTRRCTATNRAGERCGRSSALGQYVCDHHGAKAPQSIAAAKQRLAMLLEPALDVLYRATRQAPPCDVCGRSDADRDPTAVRAAGMILDRCGLGATMKLEVSPLGGELADLSIDDLIVKLESMLDAARVARDSTQAALVEDGVLVEDVGD